MRCPLQFYYNYVEGLREPEETDDDTIDNRIFGNIFHQAAQQLYTIMTSNGRGQVTASAIDKMLAERVTIERCVDQAINHELFHSSQGKEAGGPKLAARLNGLQIINRQVIIHYLRQLLTIDRQLAPFTILDLEGLVSMELPLSGAKGPQKATIGGRIDRLDMITDRDGRQHIRVIDYKTGHVDSSNLKVPVRHQSETDLDYLKQIPEKALQLLLYKYMYLKENPNITPEQVTAAIHGLKYANNIEFNLAKANPTKNDTDADTAFLDDSTFIHDMEAMLKEVIDEILDTEIPFVQAEDDKKCGYCDFKLICKRE
jgi:ATP-dependent helicase/DNAse subunit B